jgi:hypothetical protein
MSYYNSAKLQVSTAVSERKNIHLPLAIVCDFPGF